MKTWRHATYQKCKEVSDIIATLNKLGAGVKLPKRRTMEATLDLGVTVEMDEDLWKRMPRIIDGMHKITFRERLESILGQCR